MHCSDVHLYQTLFCAVATISDLVQKADLGNKSSQFWTSVQWISARIPILQCPENELVSRYNSNIRARVVHMLQIADEQVIVTYYIYVQIYIQSAMGCDNSIDFSSGPLTVYMSHMLKPKRLPCWVAIDIDTQAIRVHDEKTMVLTSGP